MGKSYTEMVIRKRERERVLDKLSAFHKEEYCPNGWNEREVWHKKIEELRDGEQE